jgi:hypothetical protein
MSDEPSAEKLNYWMERCTHFENVASKTWGDLSVARQERDAARAEAAALKLSLEAETKYSAALADQLYDLNKGERE